MTGAAHRVRIAAARNLVYLPHHLGIEQGHFASAGVDVTIVDHEAGRSDITALLTRGAADLVLGSLVYAHALDRQAPAAIVAVSNQQTRHFLFRRTADATGEPFDWSDLRGATVVVEPTAVPTSWVAFIAALRRQGMTLDEVRTLVGYTPGAVLDEFVGGAGEYFLAGIDAALRPEVTVAAPLCAALGPLPWSVYCARREWAQEHGGAVDAFRAGLADALRWLAAADLATATDAALACFPGHDRALVELTIDHYRAIGFWAADPRPVADDVARWEAYLQDGGLLPPTSHLTDLLDEPKEPSA